MKNARTISLGTLLSLSLGLFANPVFGMDICSKEDNQSSFVKTTVLPGERVRFEHCPLEASDEACDAIGQKESYHITELYDLYREERTDFKAKAGLGAAAVVVGGVGGLFASGALLATAFPGLLTMSGLPAGAGWLVVGAGTAGGAAAGYSVSTAIDAINPFEDLKNSQVLSAEAIRGRIANGSCKRVGESTREIVQRLENLLDQLPETAVTARMDTESEATIALAADAPAAQSSSAE